MPCFQISSQRQKVFLSLSLSLFFQSRGLQDFQLQSLGDPRGSTVKNTNFRPRNHMQREWRITDITIYCPKNNLLNSKQNRNYWWERHCLLTGCERVIYNAFSLTVEGLLAATNTGFVYSEAKLRGAEESRKDVRQEKCALFHHIDPIKSQPWELLENSPLGKQTFTMIRTKAEHFLFFS